MTRENGGVSSSKLANVLGVSESSINRIRHDIQYTFKPIRHGPVLKERHVIARLAFCQAHVNDDWSTTMFTDESRVASSPDCPIMWWVKKGDKIYTEKEKFPVSIMVWAGIIGGRKTQLLKCPNRLNAKGYVDLLENNNIVQFLQQSWNDVVFQQDGARCHTASSTRQWFADNNATLLEDWPANSPDLSPIEQIWAIAKRFRIESFGMKTPLTMQQLEDGVLDAYRRIEQRTVEILTLSMKYSVQLCVERHGGFVGDSLDECCHRARVEFDALTTVYARVIDGIHMRDGNGEGDESGQQTTNGFVGLPSYRDVQWMCVST